MFAVQVTSVVPSQNPIVSPYHCGSLYTWAVLPTITWRRKLSAMPERNWMFHGVIVNWKLPACDGCAHQRMKPSGQHVSAQSPHDADSGGFGPMRCRFHMSYSATELLQR